MKIRGQRVIPPIERIMSFVSKDENTGCWNWTGSVRSALHPYGRLVIGSRTDGSRRSVSAHVYSHQIFVGPVPAGMSVCHRCDNPRCVNPKHLFLGTAKDNADDRDRKGRNSPPPLFLGDQAPWAKLSAAQVEEIRASKASSLKLAPLYGVSDGQIRAIRRGEYYPAPPASSGQGGR